MVTLTSAQAEILPLLAQRKTPSEAAAQLGWTHSRQRTHAVVESLATLGLLRADGELPSGAVAKTWPSDRMTRAWQEIIPTFLHRIGWRPDDVRAELIDQARAGLTPPPSDDRYTRGQWSGHVIRRVEWTDFVVHGLLVPRLDGREWRRGAPLHRVVIVSDQNTEQREAWLDTRGLTVPIGELRKRYPYALVEEEIGLTMAVAWVLESRALLDAESIEDEADKTWERGNG